jgi:hypothetical protein
LGDSKNDLLDGFSEIAIRTKYDSTPADWRFFCEISL